MWRQVLAENLFSESEMQVNTRAHNGYFLSLTLCGIETNELCSTRGEYRKYVVSMS